MTKDKLQSLLNLNNNWLWLSNALSHCTVASYSDCGRRLLIKLEGDLGYVSVIDGQYNIYDIYEISEAEAVEIIKEHCN